MIDSVLIPTCASYQNIVLENRFLNQKLLTVSLTGIVNILDFVL